MKTQDGQRKANVTSRALVLAMALAVTVGAQAKEVSPWQQVCVDAWADAPASDVCTYRGLSRVGAVASGQGFENCEVRNLSCTVTARTQGGAAERWSSTSFVENHSPANTETLDVCFEAVSGSSNLTTLTESSGETATAPVVFYNAHIRTGCNAGETVSADMQGSTLSY